MTRKELSSYHPIAFSKGKDDNLTDGDRGKNFENVTDLLVTTTKQLWLLSTEIQAFKQVRSCETTIMIYSENSNHHDVTAYHPSKAGAGKKMIKRMMRCNYKERSSI